MDAGLSTDYTCYSLNRGKAMKRELQKLQLDKLNQQCAREVDKVVRGLKELEAFDASLVCADTDAMRRRVRSLLEGIDKGMTCSDEDF
jgi:hypothetical protein